MLVAALVVLVAFSLYLPLFFFNVAWFLPLALLPRGVLSELLVRSKARASEPDLASSGPCACCSALRPVQLFFSPLLLCSASSPRAPHPSNAPTPGRAINVSITRLATKPVGATSKDRLPTTAMARANHDSPYGSGQLRSGLRLQMVEGTPVAAPAPASKKLIGRRKKDSRNTPLLST